MTIQTAIERAIEGGWNNSRPVFGLLGEGFFDVWAADGSDHIVRYTFNDILLDPDFWQAVGKVEGWRSECVLHGAIAHFDCQVEWLYNWHRMIDAFASGKTVEEYLERL